MPVLLIILMISVWIGLQVGAELLARWLDKKYEEHLKKEQEKQYGRK